MPVSEFDLIRRYFSRSTPERADVLLGIGDDCALLSPPPDQCLAVTMDTLVAGRHFARDADPEALGHKALAVNLSDLAAVGAQPAWASLALTLPEVDADWLSAFMAGFAALATAHAVQLIGGDTTRGPLSITVQVHGFIEAQAALRRDAGRAGQRLFVSGTLGDAALALSRQQRGEHLADALRQRLDRPMPRVALGRALRGRAAAAIDISDGLLADLGHICASSGFGAVVELARLPLSPAVSADVAQRGWEGPLSGGDDYELLFSVAPSDADGVCAELIAAGHEVQEIGRLVDEPGITLVHPDGRQTREQPRGFDHFLT